MDIIQLIKLSPNRQVLFENIQSRQESSRCSGICGQLGGPYELEKCKQS